MVQHVVVFGIGEFDVALFAFHQGNFDIGKIAKHHTAVVCSLKVRIGEGYIIGVLESGCVKPLRSCTRRKRARVGMAAVVPFSSISNKVSVTGTTRLTAACVSSAVQTRSITA